MEIKMDLQLFADNVNVTTDAGLSVENKTFYDRALLEEAAPNLIHNQFGQKRPIPKNGGKRIEFRRYAALPKATTPLTEGVTPDGRKMTATAVEAQVRQYGDYVCILHPYVAYDIMSDPRWEQMHQYCKPENQFEGEIGRIAGVRFVETSEAAVYTGTENDCPAGLAVFACLFIANGAYGVTEVTGGGLQTIIKQLGSAGTADPLDQRSTVGWKALQTAEILQQAYLYRVECCSAFSPEAKMN